MAQDFKTSVKHRRTNYNLSNKSLITDHEIEEIVSFALMNIPSAFNSQTTRIVLLLGENHQKVWDITKDVLKKIVPAENFPATENKINGAFASGYGTILFFEDEAAVKSLQEAFPAYKDNFPIWSQHTNAMHQLTIWTLLEDAGFGASLQHYNPLINEEVSKTWNLNSNWELVAQMPFGVPTQAPGEKLHIPLSDRIKIFK